MVWVPQASCELSLSLGRKGFYAHRGSMSHGSWEKSANWWEFPAKFFLFCFALRALLLSTAQLWPVLLFLSKGTQALLVLPASIPDTGSIETKVLCCKCSPHCLPTSPEASLLRRGTGYGCSSSGLSPWLGLSWAFHCTAVLQNESGSLAWSSQCTQRVTSVPTASARLFAKLHCQTSFSLLLESIFKLFMNSFCFLEWKLHCLLTLLL